MAFRRKKLKPLFSCICFVFFFCSTFGAFAKDDLGATPPMGKPKQTLTLIHAIKLPQLIHGLSLSPDGKLLAAGHLLTGQDLTVSIWDLEKREKVKSMEGSAARAPARYSPDGKYLFSGAWTVQRVTPPQGTVSAIWRVQDGALLREWGMVAQAYTFSPNSSILALGTLKELELYGYPEMKPEGSIKGAFGSLRFSEDGTLFAANMASTSTGKVGVWRMSDRKQLLTVKSKAGFGRGVVNRAFSKDNKYLATGHPKGIDIWRMKDGKKVTTIVHKLGKWKKRTFPNMGLAFSDDGEMILAMYVDFFSRGNKGAGIWMWRIADKKLVSSYVTEGVNNEIPWWPYYQDGVMIQKSEKDVLSFWRLEDLSKKLVGE